jgi:hypothetical protein
VTVVVPKDNDDTQQQQCLITTNITFLRYACQNTAELTIYATQEIGQGPVQDFLIDKKPRLLLLETGFS